MARNKVPISDEALSLGRFLVCLGNIDSEAPRAREESASRDPFLRKSGNLSIREILV